MHRLAGDRRALGLVLCLVASFLVVEVVAGWLAGSLALLADAGHMLGDVGALGLALGAAWLGARPATPGRSFGFRRAEILAALVNGVALVAVAIWVAIEGVQRLRDPGDPEGTWMLVVGAAGLVLNLVSARILQGRSDESLNVRAALLHVLADALGSLGVIAAGVAVLMLGWERADAVAALAIAAFVLAGSWALLRDAVGILLELAPRGLDPEEIGHAMVGVDGVREVHDLHVWSITSGFPSLSAHVLVGPDADCHAKRRELEEVLGARFGLTHTTLQVEHADEGTVSLSKGIRERRTPL